MATERGPTVQVGPWRSSRAPCSTGYAAALLAVVVGVLAAALAAESIRLREVRAGARRAG